MDRFASKVSRFKDRFQRGDDQRKTTASPQDLFEVHESGVSDASQNQLKSTPRPVKVGNIQELGNVSSSSTLVKRDLGFQGKLGTHILLTYGDTMYTDAAGSDEFRGMTCNSAAIACNNPTRVFDAILGDHGFPDCLLLPNKDDGEDPSVYSLGLTNVVESSHGKGIIYFLLNYRPEGKDNLLGSGAAEVTIDTSSSHPVPKATRLSKFWWNGETEPWYGDVCALRFDDHIYAYGHAKDNPWVYLTRVAASRATDLSSYEYWNGDGWQSERLNREDLNDKQSVFWQINQGQVIWSRYHQCFLFIYCDNFWSCQVLAKTASAPEGPWSEPITIHKPKPVQEGGNVYTAIPHPYYDETGKTLTITYTNHPNTIQAIKVDFE